MNNQKNKNEQESHDQLHLNKGIEFMLRRGGPQTKSKQGFRWNQTLTLLRKTFHFTLEFSWKVDNQSKE